MALTKAAKRMMADGVVSVLDYGADNTGAVDSTAAFNLATMAAETFSSDVQRRSIFVPPGLYKIDGAVYVRKGQSFYSDGGQSADLSLGTTGTIILGKNSSGVEDSGGAPPVVKNLQLTGGSRPIEATISGYTIENIFVSAQAGSCRFWGTDGRIYGCTFDGLSSGLVSMSGGAHTVTNCGFYQGSSQLTITGTANNISITNCTFGFPSVASMNYIGAVVENIVVDSCTFIMNEQFGTFEGYVNTQTSTGLSLNVKAQYNNCSFCNGAGYGFNFTNGGSHNITISDCVFDGNKTSSGFTQSTTAKGAIFDAVNSTFTVRNCTFRNMLGAPIKTDGVSDMEVSVLGCKFANNGGSVDIDLSNDNNTSKTYLADIQGSGRALFDATNINTSINLTISGLSDWFDTGTSGGRNFAKIPYVGAGLWNVYFSSNPSDGSTPQKVKHRVLEAFQCAVYYGSTPTDASTHTKLVAVSQFVDAGVSASDLSVEFNTVGGGSILDGVVQEVGDLVFSWDDGYYDAAISIQPAIMNKLPG